MKPQQTQRIMDELLTLKEKPLVFVFRSMDMICFEFGDIIKKKVLGKNDEGKAALVEEKAGRYALHVQSYFRLSCGSDLVLAKGDVFQPSSELANDPEYNEKDFDWTPNGNNRFDEIVQQHFEESSDYIVGDVSVNGLGDLKIKFANGFRLEVQVDVSGPEECWRFFEAGAENHLIVNGQGIEDDV